MKESTNLNNLVNKKQNNKSIVLERDLLKSIETAFKKERILLIFGARQVGKTTSSLIYYESIKENKIKIGEDKYIQEELGKVTIDSIKKIIGQAKFVFIDEAQYIPDIGTVLKLIYDTMPTIKVLATGSSAFGLAARTSESMAGRKKTLSAFPLTLKEIKDNNIFTYIDQGLDGILVLGLYPRVLTESDFNYKKEILLELAESYLYKDVLNYQGIRNAPAIAKLAQLLALQIGSQVSLSELSRQLGISRETVEKYIDILEKSFIIFTLSAYSSNKRNEISKSKKYYFWDLGIRNAIIKNFENLDLRNDAGAIWENLVIAEKIKKSRLVNNLQNFYFWRSYSGVEVDLIVESNNKLEAYEIKLSKDKTKAKNEFYENYPDIKIEIINRDNYQKYLL